MVEIPTNARSLLFTLNLKALIIFSDTSVTEIEEAFQQFTTRKDIAIVLMNQNVSISWQICM